jgi:hypothetical protein
LLFSLHVSVVDEDEDEDEGEGEANEDEEEYIEKMSAL